MNTKYNFQLDVSGDTYAGELALPYIAAAVKSGDTLAKNYVDVMEGFNHKAVIKNLSFTADPLVAGGASNCAFSDSDADAMTLGERVLTLTDLKVNQEICRAEIFPTFVAANNAMQRNGDMPIAFEEFIIASVAEKVAESLENAIWKGSSIFGNGFLADDGAADTDAELTNGLMGGFTEADFSSATSASTVLDNLNQVYDSVVDNHSGLLGKTDFGFYMNLQTYGFYMQALAGAGTSQGQNGGFGYSAAAMANSYMGYPVYVCPGIPNDTVIATYKSNLKFGSNLQTDTTRVEIIPTYKYDGSDNIRVVMHFAAGVQVAVATDGVLGTSVWTP
jgi:hypothetical protein